MNSITFQIFARCIHLVDAVEPVLGEAEVDELDVAVQRDHDVLRLHVAVHDLQRVEEPQRQADLRHVEPRLPLGDPTVLILIRNLAIRIQLPRNILLKCRESFNFSSTVGIALINMRSSLALMASFFHNTEFSNYVAQP